MKKMIIFILIGFAVGAGIVVGIGFFLGLVPIEKTTNETAVTNSDEVLAEVLTLNFDNQEDLYWFNMDRGIRMNSVDALKDGMFLLEDLTFFKQKLIPNTILHFRIKQPDLQEVRYSSVCFDIMPEHAENEENYRVTIAYKDLCYFSVGNSYGWNDARFYGSAMLGTPEWMDIIIYISEDSDVLGTVIVNAENQNDISCASWRLPGQWQVDEYMINFFQDTSGWSQADLDTDNFVEIDFVKITYGSITKYLEENIPAYTAKKDYLEKYLITENIEIIDENEFNKHDHNPEDEQSNEDDEMQDNQEQSNYGLLADAGVNEILLAYFSNQEIKASGTFLDINNLGTQSEIIDDDGTEYYSFTTSGSEGRVEINPRLKTACGNERNQQGFYTEFMYDSAIGSSFTFLCAREAIVSFEEDGIYFNFSVGDFRNPFYNNMNELMVLEDGKVYCMAVGFDESAVFRCIIWEEGNFYNRAFYQCNLAEISIDVTDNDWKVTFSLAPENKMEMYENSMFTFEYFTDNMPDYFSEQS